MFSDDTLGTMPDLFVSLGFSCLILCYCYEIHFGLFLCIFRLSTAYLC